MSPSQENQGEGKTYRNVASVRTSSTPIGFDMPLNAAQARLAIPESGIHVRRRWESIVHVLIARRTA